MEDPIELSLAEIRDFMLENGCKVTNHALVKHFKKFLTNPDTQNESRKQFKTYVNILATIKNENNQKYLILRKKYLNECPSEDIVNRTETPMSPGAVSLATSEGEGSPFRQPPPYKPPPEVSPSVVKLPILDKESKTNYRECVNEFQAAINQLDSNRFANQSDCQTDQMQDTPPSVPPRKRSSVDRSISRESSIEENKENLVSSNQVESRESSEKNGGNGSDVENPISVKEATRKFNRMASEEEAKVISPPSKKKPEKTIVEDKISPEVTLSHPKAKEWIVSAAKANYQELAKLASEYPELIKLQDPTTGYTALHWAAKHGNEDVVKLIAGTFKGDVNDRTNGGYTPLHLAMQFGKDNIFELLCNVYKANRDLLDWSGNKPLDYRKQRTTVSASTYSSEYDLLKPQNESNRYSYAGENIGSLGFIRKKRNSRHRYATASGALVRAHSMMMGNTNKHSGKQLARISSTFNLENESNTDHSPLRNNTNNNNNNVDKITRSDDIQFVKRKESFLRKKFRPIGKSNMQDILN